MVGTIKYQNPGRILMLKYQGVPNVCNLNFADRRQLNSGHVTRKIIEIAFIGIKNRNASEPGVPDVCVAILTAFKM